MAKTNATKPTADLVSPKGTRVTVHADRVDALKARGYTAPGNTRRRKSTDSRTEQDD